MSSPLISDGPLLKSAVFGTSLSLPPLVNEGGGLVCESVGKADLLSDHFNGRLLICRSLAIRLLVLPPCLQVERGLASLVRLGPVWWH